MYAPAVDSCPAYFPTTLNNELIVSAMKTLRWMAFIITAAVVLHACTPPEQKPDVETKPRSVRTDTIVSRDLPILVRAVGRLAPDREVVLSAQVSGILASYRADVGTQVRAGATLVTLEDADYVLALKEAEANLLSARIRLPVAKNAFARAQSLLPEKAITPELYDQAEAAYAAAKATVVRLETLVAMAQRRLEKTTIAAPFGGHVTQRFVESGQTIAVGEPLMKIADMRSMRVNIHISELDYVHLDKDDPVSVTVEAYAGATVPGRVDKIGIQADARTNTFSVEILVDNSDFTLKAGLTARVAIQTRVIPSAVMIAQHSVLYREDRQEVFVVDADNRAVARTIQLGRLDGSEVRILAGLQPGDNLVVSGAQYLKPGDRVRVVP